MKINDNSYPSSNTQVGWNNLDFISAEYSVRKQQRHILNSYTSGNTRKLKFIQHQLIHSFYAKVNAVKSVTSSRGKYTAGVDNIIWKTPEIKYQAVLDLNRRDYIHQPFKRIYIPKGNSEVRAIDIPTIKDRAMQTLYRYTIEPIAEYTADPHSYGFRKNLSTRDAILHCYNILNSNNDYKWIFKTDIRSFFDTISHEWIMNNVPMDKFFLNQFLTCGYVDKGILYQPQKGIPQGSCISPVLCNLALNGLEETLKSQFNGVEFIRYADDILLISKVHDDIFYYPLAIGEFLSKRGLDISIRKTGIYNVRQGFDFLGWHISKDKFPVITPSLTNINSLMTKVKYILSNYIDYPSLFCKMSSALGGWISYHRDVIDIYSMYGVLFDVCMYIWDLTNDSTIVNFASNFISSL